MFGELHDFHYPERPSIYDQHAKEAGYVLQTGFGIVIIYFMLLRGLSLIPTPSEENIKHFNETGLK